VWKSDPKNTIFGEAAKRTLTAGGLGSVGEKAAAALADFIVLDMFANVAPAARTSGLDQDRRAPGDAALPVVRVLRAGECLFRSSRESGTQSLK